MAEELKRRVWDEREMARRAKGTAAKVAIAMWLRKETVMSVKWIAARLHMGTPGYVNHLLYRQQKGKC